MSDKITTGARGERLAEKHMKSKGFKIVARNYRHRHAEIDLIAQKGDLLVFVEVKTRSSTAFGEPESFVSDEKANKVMEAADHYIFTHGWDHEIRFDIIAVTLGRKTEIEHFEDAFY